MEPEFWPSMIFLQHYNGDNNSRNHIPSLWVYLAIFSINQILELKHNIMKKKLNCQFF